MIVYSIYLLDTVSLDSDRANIHYCRYMIISLPPVRIFRVCKKQEGRWIRIKKEHYNKNLKSIAYENIKTDYHTGKIQVHGSIH